MGLFVSTWSLSFGYQFYPYSIVFSNAEVDTTWSFGQMVATTIWAPCLVEYLNLELSEYFTAPYAASIARPALLRTGNIAGILKGSEYKFPAPLRLTMDNYVQHISCLGRQLEAIPPPEYRNRSNAQQNDNHD